MPSPPGGAEFDPAAGLPCIKIQGRDWHTMWIAAQHLRDLLADGRPAAIDRAERIAAALPAFQDDHPASATFGNLRWELEDAAVEDLNAAVFFAVRAAPALLEHGGSLCWNTQQQLQAMLARSLTAIERLDVGWDYTNIVGQSVAALIVGARVLNDPRLAAIGAERLRGWGDLVAATGSVHEYNSPVYAGMTLAALSLIERHAERDDLRALAAAIAWRQAAGVAMRTDPATRRLAPPHCRAYAPSLLGRTTPMRDVLDDWIAGGIVPSWTAEVADHPIRGVIRETSDRALGVHLAGHYAPWGVLGTASRDLDGQANRFIEGQSTAFGLHYVRSDGGPGTVFARHVIDDTWLGDYTTTPSRPRDQVFLDQGAFLGVQDGPRMLGAYRARGLDARARVSSVKTCIMVAHAADVGAVRVGGQAVDPPGEETATALPHGAGVVLALGPIHLAVRPLGRGDLQRCAPMRLRRRNGMMVLEMFDYEGPPRTFWQLGRPSAFWSGHPRSAFYAEMIDASGVDIDAASARLDADVFVDDVEPPRRLPDGAARRWTLAHARDGASFGMEVDLANWRLVRDWTTAGEIGLPMLSAPNAAQSVGPEVAAAGATLACGKRVGWIVGVPEAGLWVAGVHPGAPGPVALAVPGGKVRIGETPGALIEWRGGVVRVEHSSGGVEIEGGRRA